MKILDCTIRDGSYATKYNWPAHLLKQIVATLANNGISYIEVGNGTGLGTYRQESNYTTDCNYLQNTVPYKSLSKIGAFFIPGIGTNDDLKYFKENGGDFIRIGVNATDTQKAYKYIEYAKSLGLYVFCNLMKTYAVSRFQFVSYSDGIVKSGADCIYVVDSAGGMLPNQVEGYIKALKDFYSVSVGFHGHNNLLMANANSLAAAKAGADFVDATLGGLGRGAGNAQIESLMAVLLKAGYDFSNDRIIALSELSNNMFNALMKAHMGNSKREIIVGCANFHDSYTSLLEKYASMYNVNPEQLLIEVSKINIINPSEDLFKTTAEHMVENQDYSFFANKFYHIKY